MFEERAKSGMTVAHGLNKNRRLNSQIIQRREVIQFEYSIILIILFPDVRKSNTSQTKFIE